MDSMRSSASSCRGAEPGSLRVALGVSDVPADEEDSWQAAHVVEHREQEVRLLPRRLLIVAVPGERFVEHLGEVRPATQDLVVDRVRTGDPALATGLGFRQAQETDDVSPVGVEILALIGPVEADARIGACHPLVTDVPEQGGVGILAHRSAQLEPEADVGQLGRLRREQVDRESA